MHMYAHVNNYMYIYIYMLIPMSAGRSLLAQTAFPRQGPESPSAALGELGELAHGRAPARQHREPAEEAAPKWKSQEWPWLREVLQDGQNRDSSLITISLCSSRTRRLRCLRCVFSCCLQAWGKESKCLSWRFQTLVWA